MLYNIPIENIEERYSADWNKWFPREFEKLGIKFRTIYGETLTDKIIDGSFLDVCGTNYFKADQIKQLCRLLFDRGIKDGDILFFHDLWFPGLEALAYIRDGLRINFKITGVLHAGTYTPYDPIERWGMDVWGKDLENSWFKFVDEIFVATHYHKNLILSKRQCNPDKIVVTGLPIYFSDYPSFQRRSKSNYVIFPHRLEPERQPEQFDKLSRLLPAKGWCFLKTKEVCQNKTEYLDMLSRTKIVISTSKQETWGIAMQESIFFDCLPVVPDAFSYKELYYPKFRYSTFDELLALVEQMMVDYKDFVPLMLENRSFLMKRGEIAISNMIMEFDRLGDLYK